MKRERTVRTCGKADRWENVEGTKVRRFHALYGKRKGSSKAIITMTIKAPSV